MRLKIKRDRPRGWVEVIDKNELPVMFVLSEVVVLLGPFREHVHAIIHLLAFLSLLVLILERLGISIKSG